MPTVTVLDNKRIVLGVTGSIACYKAIDLASRLTQAGVLVDVVLSEAATRFVTPLTFEAVTGQPVYHDLWQSASGATAGAGLPTHIAHVGLAEGADLLAVVPATAQTLAKLAHGYADSLLTITALATQSPLLLAPAMDGHMWQHRAVMHNVQLLMERGAVVVEPEVGRFASGLIGQGRLPETPTLMGHIRHVLGRDGLLRGRHIVVTAGGTREPIDPVRYITNHSTGRQGIAIAQAALDAGARVTLISSAEKPAPIGATLVTVEDARQMHDAVLQHLPLADALVMAAAVSDFRSAQQATQKIKKTGDDIHLTLTRNPDILLAVRDALDAADPGQRRRPVIVGFAAESENLIDNAQDKLQRKQLDLLVANDITASDAGFASEDNRVALLRRDASPEILPLMPKSQLGERICHEIAMLLRTSAFV